MLEKVKQYVKDHPEEAKGIAIGLATLGGMVAFYAMGYHTGYAVAKPIIPDNLKINFFEHDGINFMRINGKLFKKIV